MFSLRKGTIIMTNNPRYTLGTEANRIFMASETYELLKFGKGFPAPTAVPAG